MQLKQHLAENYLTLNAYIGKEDLKSIVQAFSSRNQKSKNKKQTNKQTNKKARTKATQIMQKSRNNKEQKSKKIKT